MPPDAPGGYPPPPSYPPQPSGYQPQDTYPPADDGQAPGYPVPSQFHPTPVRAVRPRLLVIAVAEAVSVAVLTVLAHVLALTSGRTVVEDALRSELGENADLVQGLIAATVDDAYGTLKARASIGVFVAAVVVILALLSLRAGLVARILLALSLVVSALVTLLAISDIFPAAGKIVGSLAILFTPVAAVLPFLPAVNRYRTARRSGAVR